MFCVRYRIISQYISLGDTDLGDTVGDTAPYPFITTLDCVDI